MTHTQGLRQGASNKRLRTPSLPLLEAGLSAATRPGPTTMAPSTIRRVAAVALPRYATSVLGFLALVALLGLMSPQGIPQAHAATAAAAFVGGAASAGFGSRTLRATQRAQGQVRTVA
jgi:hypothetical protein